VLQKPDILICYRQLSPTDIPFAFSLAGLFLARSRKHGWRTAESIHGAVKRAHINHPIAHDGRVEQYQTARGITPQQDAGRGVQGENAPMLRSCTDCMIRFYDSLLRGRFMRMTDWHDRFTVDEVTANRYDVQERPVSPISFLD
jgi:hypothetical protein